jgi:hypothetical protein
MPLSYGNSGDVGRIFIGATNHQIARPFPHFPDRHGRYDTYTSRHRSVSDGIFSARD